MQKWLEQLGLVKKLQLALLLSWILIILLGWQIMKINHNSEKHDPVVGVPELDLNRAKVFASDYLKIFFNPVTDQGLEYLKKHSNEELFIKNIYPELTARRKENIESNFTIDQLYIEAVTNTSSKVVCFGQERFPSGAYQTRELSIELLIDQSEAEPKVASIPVFRAT